MFGDINQVTLMGNVTKDPEVRALSSGSEVMNLSIATNYRIQNKTTSQWENQPEFHEVVVWKGVTELAKRIKKGTKIYVEGRLKYKTWESNGVKKYKTEIDSYKIILLDRYLGKDETSINPDDLPF